MTQLKALLAFIFPTQFQTIYLCEWV